MKTRVFENPVKFAQSVKVNVDGEYVSLLELLQNADIELDETPTSGSDKAVSSGGVFNALQEKQGQISITKNDDGSVDINIPDVGEVSKNKVTFINIGDLNNNPLFTTEDDAGYLDLRANGEYLLDNSAYNVSIEDLGVSALWLTFGFIEVHLDDMTFNYPKPFIPGFFNSVIDGAGFDNERGCYLGILLEYMSEHPLYVKVTDYCVYIGYFREY